MRIICAAIDILIWRIRLQAQTNDQGTTHFNLCTGSFFDNKKISDRDKSPSRLFFLSITLKCVPKVWVHVPNGSV